MSSADVEHLVKVDGKVGTPVVGWWDRYELSLRASSMTETARIVVASDSRYILESGVFACGRGGLAWPATRQRSGIVMGSVQSGKTASMLGVTALAIDAGLDVVVILAGTRISLWRQTYDRLVRQLAPGRDDLVVPSPALMAVEGAGPSDLFRDLTAARARRALRNSEPIVLVVMKHGQHLRAAALALHERVYPIASKLDRSFEVLVLDDEADDGSILDAVVEGDLDPAQDAFKQIPRHIVDLWSVRSRAGETAHPNVFATYVGYTATPQANFLQVDQNALAPRDFIAALRTPANSGGVETREATFLEPVGLPGYYTGGEVYYTDLSGPNGLIVTEKELAPQEATEDAAATRREWICEALRAYLVAGAIKLWRDPGGRRLSRASEASFESLDVALSTCPDAHTMLLHPSPGVGDHFSALAEVLEWGRGLTSLEAEAAVSEGCRSLSRDVLVDEIEEHEDLWRRWIDNYCASADRVRDVFGLEQGPCVPAQEAWEEIRAFLVDEVIPNVKLSVVNSDPAADDRPQFWPMQQATGSWTSPNDVFSIFVSGNVMARGLTLEGLTTTLFLRSSGDPIADTQMQMQRWFGYRGRFLELCRVFMPTRQMSLFKQYHESDEALRLQIIEAMNESPGLAPSPLVIEGADFRATGKIAGVSKVPLCPGSSPFVDIVNNGATVDPNVGIVAQLFQQPSSKVFVGGTLRGRVLNAPVELESAASLLDQLAYASYVPDPDDPTTTRWKSLEDQLGMARDVHQPLVPFLRPPATAVSGTPQGVAPIRCPYNIAAYLRLWKACLDRRARGLFPTEDGERPWSSLDLAERRRDQPMFYVGLRFGSATSRLVADDPARELPFEANLVERSIANGRLGSTWGSRNPGESSDAYAGDQFFDYHVHGRPLPEKPAEGPRWRPVGSPGLLLFHLISAPGHAYSVAALGVCIPLGGPDHFAARRRQ